MNRYHSYYDRPIHKVKAVAKHVAAGLLFLFISFLFLNVVWIPASHIGELATVFAVLATLLWVAGSVWIIASYIEDEV